jgi:hypothetical protein
LANYPQITQLELENYFFDDREERHKVFGTYNEHDILHSCVFVEFSNQDRSWTIRYAVQQLFASVKTTIVTIDYAISFAEQAKFYRGSVAYFDKHYKEWERLMSTHSDTFSKYICNTEEIIPMYKKSSFEKYWNNIQRRVSYPRQLVIREYVLPQEYRTYFNATI